MADDPNKDGKHDIANKHYEKTFASKKQLQEMEENAAKDSDEPENPDSQERTGDQVSDSAKKANSDIKAREANPSDASWKTSTTAGSGAASAHVGRTALGTLRNGSAYAFLIALVVGGVWYTSFFAPNIIMVNIKEMFVNDLADATIALWAYDKKVLDHKLGGGCADETIKCKLGNMSRQQVKAFEKAGFKVNGSKVKEDNRDDNIPENDQPESRYMVSSLTFPHGGGTASSADDFEKIANSSLGMKNLAYSVFHPKSGFFLDKRFQQRLEWRFNLGKTPTVGGTTEKDVDDSFNESLEGPDERFDEAGGGNYSLRGLAGDVGKEGIKDVGERLMNEANSYIQLQCAYYTLGKVATNATKRAKVTTVARFAAIYLKAADQIKSGVASDEIPMNTLSSKLAWSPEGGYNGKNATDSNIYKHILYGDSVTTARGGHTYTLDTFDAIGEMLQPWLEIEQTALETKAISGAPGMLIQPPADINGGARDYCLFGQTTASKSALKPQHCPVLTIAAAPMAKKSDPQLQAISQGSDRICPPPPKGIWKMYPTSTTHATAELLMPYVIDIFTKATQKWAKKTDQNWNADIKSQEAAYAIFAGTGAILGDMAQSRGMRPGNLKTMKEYLESKAEIQKEIDEVARYRARNNPFDVMDKYSFLGNLARSFTPYYSHQSPAFASLVNIFSMIPASFKNLSESSAKAFFYIQPLEFDTSRLTKCADVEFLNIEIEADIACNIRYSMSKAEIDADPQKVLEYMLQPHSDETQEGVQELTQRLAQTDEERDIENVTRQLTEAQTGAQSPMIDEKTGEAKPYTEYEKFLNFCVNREDPWGRTGISIRRTELSDEEKKEKKKDKKETGEPVDQDQDSGDPYEKKPLPPMDPILGMMAVSEGTKADQEWYSGKKCMEESEMLNNFRAYTMICSVDGTHAGSIDCSEEDDANYYYDGFYYNNDILFTSFW